MIDIKTITLYAQHPELATESLAELLACVESEDETVQSAASEALENCGPPNSKDWPYLCDQLHLTGTDLLFWSSTLLGRLGTDLGESEQADAIRSSLVSVVLRDTVDLSAREKAAWALGEIGGLPSSSRTQLESVAATALPRLKRLLEAAFSAIQEVPQPN